MYISINKIGKNMWICNNTENAIINLDSGCVVAYHLFEKNNYSCEDFNDYFNLSVILPTGKREIIEGYGIDSDMEGEEREKLVIEYTNKVKNSFEKLKNKLMK